MAQFPASGALFVNARKTSATQPDYTGNLELEHDVIRDLMAQVEEGVEHPRVDIACWKKVSKAGKSFMSLRGNIIRDRQEGGGYQPQASQAPSGYRKPTADAVGSSAKSIDDEIPF